MKTGHKCIFLTYLEKYLASELFFFHLSEFINCTHFDPIKSIKLKKKVILGNWRDGVLLKSPFLSSGGPEFYSQHGIRQSPETLTSGSLMPLGSVGTYP